MLKNTTSNCLNCEEPLQDGFKFCPNCGQKTNDVLTIGVLFYNTIANYFSFDARFFKSFVPLMFKPGILAKSFVQGKRLLYLHPAQMYLFVSVVFFFLSSFGVSKKARSLDESLAKTFKTPPTTDGVANTQIADSVKLSLIESERKIKSNISDIASQTLKSNIKRKGLKEGQIDSILENKTIKVDSDTNFRDLFDFNEKKVDSLILLGATDEIILKELGLQDDTGLFKQRLYKKGLKFYRNRKGGSFLQSIYDIIPVAMFFLLPIFAFILKLFYFRKGRYAHHMVFSFYYFSFLFTTFSIIVGVNMIWDIPNWLDWLVAASTFIYFFIALKRFYGQGWFSTFIKANITTCAFLLFVIPLTAAILGVFTFLYY